MTDAARLSALLSEITALKAEAEKYKTVRVSWLARNLRRILDETPAPPPAIVAERGPRPVTLLRFLALTGGLADHGDLRAMNAEMKFIPGAGMLVRREGGMSLDRARESAEQFGYLPDESDIGDLLNAIDDELRGVYRYRAADAHQVAIAEMEARFEEDAAREMAAEAVGETAVAPFEAINADCPF